MAQHVIVKLVDDIDGSDAAVTVPFALDGKSYEIDLSDSNAATLREILTPFTAAARTVGKIRRARAAAASSEETLSRRIRRWAADNDIAVPARGRIPDAVIAQYQAQAN